MFDGFLMSLGVAAGKLVYSGFEKFTAKTAETQEKLILDHLKRNAETEYGKKYGFASIKSVKDYQDKVPLSDYSDYADYVQRMIAGEHDLIISGKVNRYVETSGSSGTPKIVPMSPKGVFNVQAMGFCGPEYCTWRFHKKRGTRMYLDKNLMTWIVMERSLPNGEKICDGASIPISIMRPFMGAYTVSPANVIFTDYPDKIDVNYLLLRFGLPYKNVSNIGAILVSSAVSMFQYLEKNWQVLCDDIEKGIINDSVELEPEYRRSLEKRLRPMPERAAELRAEFEKGFDNAVGKRIWPKLSWVYGMASSTLAPYAERIRYYVGPDVPLHNFGYGASEGYFAMPLEPDSSDAVMLPRSNFFEFIPQDEPAGERPLLMHELKVGQKYEVILTNLSGFYRYRLGDIVECTGYYNTAPKVRFLYRSNVTVNITDEKTTQSMLDQAIAETSQASGLGFRGYSVYGNTDDKEIHYTLLVDAEKDLDEDELRKLGDIFDEKLCGINVEYNRYRVNHTLKPVDVHLLKPGAHNAYREMLRAQGRDTSQVKPVTIINTPERKEFFFSNIIRSSK